MIRLLLAAIAATQFTLASALGAKKSAAKKAPSKEATADGAGVGKDADPVDTTIAQDALIPRANASEAGTHTEETPSVDGDKHLLAIDVTSKRPVEVFLIDALNLHPDAESQSLVFVQGAVSTGLHTEEVARSKFATKGDGTLLYNSRGFDEVPHDAKFNLVDIAKLIRIRNGQK